MPVRRSNLFIGLAILGAGLVVAAYIYLYAAQPLPEPWNANIQALLISLAAIGSAVMATLNARHFLQADRGPRRVWDNLAIALWLWAIAETIIFVYYVLEVEPPLVSIADAFWMVGYVFFAAALIHQYHLVYQTSRRREVGIALGVTGGILAGSVIITVLIQLFAPSEKTWLDTLVAVLYPFLDLAVGLGALWLVYAFGGSLWSRPWIGLFVFALADALYAWLEVTGLYESFVATSNPLNVVADVIYLAAYLVVAIACFSTLLLLQYGLPSAAAPEAEPAQ